MKQHLSSSEFRSTLSSINDKIRTRISLQVYLYGSKRTGSRVLADAVTDNVWTKTSEKLVQWRYTGLGTDVVSKHPKLNTQLRCSERKIINAYKIVPGSSPVVCLLQS
jgi:hypothetical protein